MIGVTDYTRRTLKGWKNGVGTFLAAFLLVVGLAGGLTHEVGHAQTFPFSEHSETVEEKTSPSGVGSVPEWARSPRSSSQSESFGSSRAETTLGGEFRTQNHGGRHTVPVDGGIVWLFLAGVGYGIFRLGRKKRSQL